MPSPEIGVNSNQRAFGSRSVRIGEAIVCLLTIVLCMLTAAQQITAAPQHSHKVRPQSTATTQPGFVLKVQSRLVVIDVSVKNWRGRPIENLQKSDFNVFENGKLQRIESFEHLVFEPRSAGMTAMPQRKGEYSNIAVRPGSVPAINIILFDLLNTPFAAQIYGREQMVKFLKTLPPGEPTAILELTDHLKLISGFSTNSSQLRAAAEKLRPYPSPWLISESEAENAAAFQAEIGQAMGSATSNLGSFIESYRGIGEGQRMAMTAKAFRDIADAVAGYPGRKNILWLSEGFPVNFSPRDWGPRAMDPGFVLNTPSKELLASAQVAVYPIDVRGLVVDGPSASLPDFLYASQVGELSHARELRLASSQMMMDDIARDTGGEAFYNTNDLEGAMRRAIEDGSDFYSLAYVPSNQNWNGKYRRIKVKIDHLGLHLAYRRGYFARDWHPTSMSYELAFSSALQPGVPEATTLPFSIRVMPPDLTASLLTITYKISGQHIDFYDAPDGRKHARIKFAAIAYGKDGKPDAFASQLATLNLTPGRYMAGMKFGFEARQQIMLRPGDDDLRIGVLDKTSGAFGTLDIPIPSVKP